MAITNYTELKAAVADWLNRDDLTSRIQDYISLAEAGFNRTIRTRDMIARQVATTSNEFVPLPPDWLETYQLELPPSNTSEANAALTYIGPGEAAKYQAANMDGKTRYYTITDGQFELIPKPATGSSVTLTCTYYARITGLSNITATNWLLTKCPDLYLYASLGHAAPYLNNDERIAVWKGLADQAYQELMYESERSSRSRVSLTAARRSFN